MRFTLYQGTKYYSSWAMRPWVLMREAEIPFKDEEPVIQPFEDIGMLEQLVLDNAITDKMPVLVDHQVQDNLLIWDTLAICDYLAEQFPEKQLWPADTVARAQARSICGQMHSGFVALRSYFPVNIEISLPQIGQLILRDNAAVAADIQYLTTQWLYLLQRSGGPMLFGDFSIADAFVLPFCLRFRTYEVPLRKEIVDYMDWLCQLPSVQKWFKESASLEEDFYSFEGLQ